MTKRIIRAMQNPNVDIIGHPTGRIINKREPYQLDLEEDFKIARKNGIVMEINAFWNRLDLNDINIRLAKNFDVKMSIDTDAHSLSGLDMMIFGVATARRGWAEKKDIINTLPLNKLLKIFK